MILPLLPGVSELPNSDERRHPFEKLLQKVGLPAFSAYRTIVYRSPKIA